MRLDRLHYCDITIECRNDSLYTSSTFRYSYPNRPCSEQGRGRQGQGLSVHHWTEISISIPNIEMEIRTLNVLLELTNCIVSLLPAGSLCPTGHSFSPIELKETTVQARHRSVGHVRQIVYDAIVRHGQTHSPRTHLSTSKTYILVEDEALHRPSSDRSTRLTT